jgi:ABC-type uncharacterized transport system involved in gliding motility auxiliary subunit
VGVTGRRRAAWAAGALGGLGLVVAACLFFVFRELSASVMVSIGVGFGGLTLFLWVDRDALGEASQSRGVMYGTSATVLVFMCAAVVVVGYLLADRNDRTWDFTRDGHHALSDQTVSVLEDLERPVEVLAFFQTGSPSQREFGRLMKRMGERTDQLKVTFIDPLRNPSLAQRHEIKEDRTVLFISGNDERRMDYGFSESEVIRELVLLLADKEHRICWSMGHGEPDPDDTRNENGLGSAVMALEELNYAITKSYLMTEGVDRECDALVIAGPTLGFYSWEHEAVAAYLAEGGRVFFAVDVDSMGAPMSPNTAPVSVELERYGVDVGTNLLIDMDPMSRIAGIDEPTFPVLQDQSFQRHPITDSLVAAVVLGMARSVAPIHETDGIDLTTVIESSGAAWAESDIYTHPYEFDEGVDQLGNVPVMVAGIIEDPTVLAVTPPSGDDVDISDRVLDFLSAQYDPADVALETDLRADLGAGDTDVLFSLDGMSRLFGVDFGENLDLSQVVTAADVTRLVEDKLRQRLDLSGDVGRAVPGNFSPEAGGRFVVIGDASFATNVLLELGVNRDLFMNSIAWLVEEEAQLGQRPKQGEKLPMTLLGSLTLALFSIVIMPGMALAIAIVLAVRTRFGA